MWKMKVWAPPPAPPFHCRFSFWWLLLDVPWLVTASLVCLCLHLAFLYCLSSLHCMPPTRTLVIGFIALRKIQDDLHFTFAKNYFPK